MVVTAGEDSEEGRKTLQISLVVFFRRRVPTRRHFSCIVKTLPSSFLDF
jgi:hypothetical protein